MNFLKEGKTKWKYILIVVILAFVVGGGIVAYTRDFVKEIVSISQSPVVIVKKTEKVFPKEISEEIIKEEEITNGSIFSIEEYGFSMRIHPSYIKKEEQEKGGFKRIVFSTEKDEKTIIIVIDKSENVKTARSILLDMLKLEPGEYKEIIEYSINVELISTKNIQKGTCVGKWDYYIEKDDKYEQALEITSVNLKEMHLTIAFDYYDKINESGISKMIETIECTR